MSTDDNNKSITWKRSTQNNQQTDATTSLTKEINNNDMSDIPDNNPDGIVFKKDADDVTSDPMIQMATQSAQNIQNKPLAKDNESIDDIRSEIERAFAGKEDPSVNSVSSRDQNTINIDGDIHDEEPLLPITPKPKTSLNDSISDIGDPLLPVTAKANPIEQENPQTINKDPLVMPELTTDSENITLDNHETLVASLREDIKSDFEKDAGNKPEEAENKNISGVGQTYYSDLSKAMGANDPSTMSELIKKSRFEKNQATILSPRSKRNMMYIGAALLLLLISGGIIFTIFGNTQDPVQFTSQERVSSLVFANQDTGINVTGLESERIKQVVRNVLEKKNPEDTINQIYYVEESPNGSLRRLGVKDIFDKTENQTPTLLYNNIENDFTHGFYTTNRNYPFIIMKALSYDRALEGMQEWEPTMIDDLATYFDLPPEAADRSLIEDGFEDDLIKNKNVRVARYLPREADRRGIFDFFNFNRNDDVEPVPQTNVNTTDPASTGITTDNAVEVDQGGNVVQENSLGALIKKFTSFARTTFSQKPVYAQTPVVTGVGFGTIGSTNSNDSTQRLCYQITKSCVVQSRICTDTNGQVVAFDSQSTTQSCTVPGTAVPFNSGDTNQFCSDIRVNNTALASTPAFESDLANYSCINTLAGDGFVGQFTAADAVPICFNNETGQRLAVPDQAQFCLSSYRCNLTECRANGLPVQVGSPNAQCGFESTASVPFTDNRDKICRNYPHLVNLQNLNDSSICLNDQFDYLPYNNPQTVGTGFNCIPPQARSSQICITADNKVARRTGDQIFTNDQFCFQPNPDALTRITANDQCADLTVQQVQQQIGLVVAQLQMAALLGQAFGLSGQDVNNILEVSNYLSSLALGNVLQVEEIRQTALVLQNLEVILDIIGPGQDGPSELYLLLRNIIDTVKCTLGIANTLQWGTLAQIRIPPNFNVSPGQTLPEIVPIQQVLALIGLMDPLEPTGTFDLTTQDAISQLQLANALEVTGILDPETLDLIQEVIDNQGSLFLGDTAIVNDFFVVGNGILDADGNIITGGAVDANGNIITGGAVDADGNIITGGAVVPILMIGAYNETVQNLQIILYAEGYDIDTINGLYTEQTCTAVQQFQQDNDLEIADPVSCAVSPETLQMLNNVIRSEGYLGSGFDLSGEGFLTGVGTLAGTFGPGVANFEVSEADADTLREGDVVLMYMFLDEQTVLIARDQIVIDEVIQRRVFSDIFEG